MNILLERLINQHLAHSQHTEASLIVKHMGALQAQDLPMALWACGIRTGATIQTVINALDQGTIMRAHLLRPTWHLVHADDLHWMLNLSKEAIKTTLKSRHKQLNLDFSLLVNVYKYFENAFKTKTYVARDALLTELKKAGITLNDNRGSHLLLLAELDQILCSGEVIKNETSYALYDRRVTRKINYTREESIHHLTKIYFRSHGPATLEDFSWWSGLNKTEAQKGIVSISEDIIGVNYNGRYYYHFPTERGIPELNNTVHLLPAYDEFIISYADRNPVLSAKNQSLAISSNGVFWPVILRNGHVIGIWKRTVKNQKFDIELNWLVKPSKEIKKMVQWEIERFGQFLEILSFKMVEKTI